MKTEISDLEAVSRISPSKMVRIMKDPVKSAKAVQLVYTTDSEAEGINRRRWGKKFVYYNGEEKVKDADIVVYDPEKDFTVAVSAMHSDYDHTIWEGQALHGYPVMTYSRGKLVYHDGEFVGEPGWGKFVKRVGRK